jgi:glyoxalase family protein
MISAMGLRVPSREALEWWVERFESLGVRHEGIVDRGGRAVLPFTDPEGQRLQLADAGGKPGGIPWKASPVPAEMAITGLHSVSLVVENIVPTERTLTEVMGFRRAGSYQHPEIASGEVVVFESGEGGPGTQVHVEERPEMAPGRLGIGGVHHVAFRTPDDDQHRQWRERVARAGLGVTPVIDRFYFKSIYFREPEGVLFEIATDGPGFATDEPLEHLGEKLALPPFLEPYRRQIEAGLKPIPMPAAERKAA